MVETLLVSLFLGDLWGRGDERHSGTITNSDGFSQLGSDWSGSAGLAGGDEEASGLGLTRIPEKWLSDLDTS
jgi:hypothetical protein